MAKTAPKTVVIDGQALPALETKPSNLIPFKPGPDPRRQVGRVKGSKNKVTLLRLELEESLRGELQKEGMAVLRTAIKMAKGGNEKVLKVLLDKMLGSPKGDDASDAKDTDVRITIQNLTHGEQKTAVVAGPERSKVLGNPHRAVIEVESP